MLAMTVDDLFVEQGTGRVCRVAASYFIGVAVANSMVD
jgi:hypothetical protein